LEKSLQKHFDALEAQRKQILSEVNQLSEEQLNFVPSENSWSINQIICHLAMAEELSYKAIKSRLVTHKNFENSTMMNWVRKILLRFFLRTSIKFKAPAVVNEMPLKSTLSEHTLKWKEVRLSLKELLESLPKHMQKKYIFKHPVAGKMNIDGALTFVYEHVRRHQVQINKLLKTNERF
jgi:uncharacterized damage-inducible protein DinB